VKAQGETDKPMIKAEDATAARLEVDRFTLACVLWEWPALIVNDGPSSPALKEWRLASHQHYSCEVSMVMVIRSRNFKPPNGPIIEEVSRLTALCSELAIRLGVNPSVETV
jgi:hypothetical protein